MEVILWIYAYTYEVSDAQNNCSPPTDQYPVWHQALAAAPALSWPCPLRFRVLYKWDFFGAECPTGQFGLAVLVSSPPRSLCPPTLS